MLVHYDSSHPIKLACDASAYGLGAVISHVFENGEERPIAYASRTLTTAERNYSQIEKEALSLIFGVKRFHTYLFGRTFTLVTDNKPVSAILNPTKSLPAIAAARMQRWAVFLSAYQYKLEFRNTTEHANADEFSRLPVQVEEDECPRSSTAQLYVNQIEILPVTAEDLRKATAQDPVLSKVLHYMHNGWPSRTLPIEFQPYFTRRTQLSSEMGCLMVGMRVVVPVKFSVVGATRRAFGHSEDEVSGS